jgi:predicted phosphodiesterase
LKNETPKLYVAIFDIHYPLYNKPAFNAVLDFLGRNKIDGLTLGGDQLDNAEIAHHNKGKGLYKLPGSYRKNVLGLDTHILTPLEDLAGDAKLVYHIGNHERFEYDFVEEHPELQDTVNHVKILELEKRGWKVIPLGHCSKIGKLTVAHGEILSGIGNQSAMYPSRKAVELYGTSVLAGHTHSPQSYTRIAPVEKVQKHMGWISPCCCTINPTYLRNKPTAWLAGFNIIEVMGNGDFNLYPVIIPNGRFSFAGKVYGK